MTGFHEALDEAGHIAVRHHHALGDIGQRHAVRRLVELRHQVETGQCDVEALPQPAADLALDQGRAGQEAEPQPKLFGVILRSFDGLGLGIEHVDAVTHGRHWRGHGFPNVLSFK